MHIDVRAWRIDISWSALRTAAGSQGSREMRIGQGPSGSRSGACATSIVGRSSSQVHARACGYVTGPALTICLQRPHDHGLVRRNHFVHGTGALEARHGNHQLVVTLACGPHARLPREARSRPRPVDAVGHAALR